MDISLYRRPFKLSNSLIDSELEMKISVITAVYNREKFLRQCLDSLLAQTYKNFEVILVDDGSSDSSLAILEEYCARDDRFVLIRHETNKGIVAAHRDGIVASCGDYITLLDSDDYMEPSLLENLASPALTEDVDLVIAGHTCFFEGSSKATKIFDSIPRGTYKGAECEKLKADAMRFDKKKCNRHVSPIMWSKLFKRELLLECNDLIPDSIKRADDFVRTYWAFFKATSLAVIDDYSYYCRLSPGEVQSTSKIKYEPEYFPNAIWRLEFLISNFPEKKYEAGYLDNYYYMSCMAVLAEGVSKKSKDEIKKRIESIVSGEKLQKAIELKAYKDFPFYFRLMRFPISHKNGGFLAFVALIYGKIVFWRNGV